MFLQSFDKVIFRLSCVLAALYEFYAVGMDIITGMPINHVLVDGVLLILFSFLVIMSYRLEEPIDKLQIPFVLILFLGVGYFWVESGGMRGGSIGYISMVVLMTIILIPKTNFNYIAAAAFFTMQTIFVLAEVYKPEYFSSPENLNLGSFPPTFLILNAFAGGLIALLRFLVDKERVRIMESNQLLEEKNSEIEAKNKELKEKGEEIQNINRSLEERVKERTREILFQKQQIEEFTYLNAHKLRGAITRIVGLSTLQKDESSDSENHKLRDMIDQSAREADDVLKEITTKLNEETRKNLS